MRRQMTLIGLTFVAWVTLMLAIAPLAGAQTMPAPSAPTWGQEAAFVAIEIPLVGAALMPMPQTSTFVINPTVLSFVASTEHSTTVGGTAVLTNYEARYFDGGTSVLVSNLGKPTPGTGNVIAVPVTSAGLPKNKALTVTVAAIGPGGTGVSAPSDPFAYLAAPGAAGKPQLQP